MRYELYVYLVVIYTLLRKTDSRVHRVCLVDLLLKQRVLFYPPFSASPSPLSFFYSFITLTFHFLRIAQRLQCRRNCLSIALGLVDLARKECESRDRWVPLPLEDIYANRDK